MAMSGFSDDVERAGIDPQVVRRYRLLSYSLLADPDLAQYGVKAVAIAPDGLKLFVEEQNPSKIIDLAQRAELHPASVLAVGPNLLNARGGEQIRGFSGKTGSFGCVVQDAQQREYGLSCDHVVGHTAGQISRDAVGCGAAKIGEFARGSNIVISRSASNRTDAAVFELSSPTGHTQTISGYPGAPTGVNRSLVFYDNVKKSGATTNTTTGQFMYITTMCLRYPAGVARFVDQIGIVGSGTAFSDRGDSGAVVLDHQDRVAGLVFASATRSKLGFANPISDVESELGVTII